MALFEEVDDFLRECGVYEKLSLTHDCLRTFLKRVEDTYTDLPYHNLEHICEVVRFGKVLWFEVGLGELISKSVPKETAVLALAFIIAAAVHDAGHVGLTNDFLIRSHHSYAISFNDISPNESHHTATAFRILINDQDGCNFLKEEPPETFWLFRQQVIGLVMNTDMSKHHGIVSNLRSRNFAQGGNGELTVLLQAALKCADISHTFMPPDEHVEWAQRLQQEMLLEGDKWKEKGWSPPSSMDRDNKQELAASQLAFYRYIVIPFVEALMAALPKGRMLLTAARRNEVYWNSQTAIRNISAK